MSTEIRILNSNIKVNDNFEGTVISGAIDINLSDSSGTVTPDSVSIVGNTVTIDVPDSSPAPVGATLMKTGQTTSYRTGDDGDLQEGRETDFFTLSTNNPFGNTDRFTDELGGSTYTNDIVIDWSTYDTVAGTVLGYYVDPSSRNWNSAVDNGLVLSVGTYTSGWRFANINEVLNIVCRDYTSVFDYSPFNIGQSVSSSTTYLYNTIQYLATTPQGQTVADSKTAARKPIYTRTFTVTGTTLT